MMMLRWYRQDFRRLAVGWVAAVAIAGSVGVWVTEASAQGRDAWGEQVEMLRGEIKSAEARHAGDAELGGLWLKLANRYQDRLQNGDAEDAFVRALRLLRVSGTQAQYADALDGMASLYLDTGRMKDARDFDKRALALYQAMGDQNHAGKMHETIALSFLFEHRPKEAEAESATGLAELQRAAQPDVGEVVAAHLTHSYALCFQKKCAAALDDVNEAMKIVQATFPEESLEMVTSLATRGFDEWKLGATEESNRTQTEALRLARGLKGLPQPVMAGAQLGVMRQYAAF